MRNPIEQLTRDSIRISFSSESPISKWIRLSAKGKLDLAIFNLCYCWKYVLENGICPIGDQEVKYFILGSYKEFNNKISGFDVDEYYEIFENHYLLLGDELKKFRISQHEIVQYFPSAFYSSICNFPLVTKQNFLFNGDDLQWSDIELSDMFAHQINFLEDELETL
jgi:hypothetical protein